MPGALTPRRTPSKILGPNGKPAAYFLYPSPRWNLRQYKPRFWLGADTKTNVSEYDRWELVNYSRQLFAQIDNLSVAIKEKNSWAFGDAWDPHFIGKNKAWGEQARDWLVNQFYPFCNVRGPNYDFKRSLELSGKSWDVDGDDAMVLTESASGFPQIALFPSTKIGQAASGMSNYRQPGEGPDTVKDGPFDGATIYDGIIMDRNMRMIGLRIVGMDGQYKDISAFSCDLSYNPDWHDQVRGIPRIATSLLRWMNLQDIDEFLQRGMKRAASVGLKFKKNGGEAGLGAEVITSEDDTQGTTGQTNVGGGGDAPKVYYEEIEGGEMWYLDPTTGEEIETVKVDNPHPNAEAFIERITRGAVASVGWLYEMLDLSSSGKAPTRLACDLANQSIWKQQATAMKRARRAVVYAIAKAMKNGLLPRNDDGADAFMWEFGLPKIITVDAGNEEQADRENFKLGTVSKAMIAQKRGYHWKDVAKQRVEEARQLIADAKELSTETGVPQDKVLELLEQRSANPVAQQSAKPAPGKGDNEE